MAQDQAEAVNLENYAGLPRFVQKYLGRYQGDLWALTIAEVKPTWRADSWWYLNQLYRKRPEGRLSQEAFDCALETHIAKIIGALSVVTAAEPGPGA